MPNRYYNRAFTSGPGTLAQSGAVKNEYTAIERGFDLIQEAVDGLPGVDGATSLPGFPGDLHNHAGDVLIVNNTETGYELVPLGRMRVITVSGTSYTLQESDAGALLLFTASTDVTVTVPPDVFGQGDVICMRQQSTGQVTIVEGSGVNVSSSDDLMKTRAQFAQIALVCDSAETNYFGLIGERNAPTLGYAVLTQTNNFTAGNAITPVVLTDAATINTDASLSNTFLVTIGGARTLANPTNMLDGQILQWHVKQDATGSRTLSYGSKFRWPNGVAPTLATAAGSVDIISAQYIAADDKLRCVKQGAYT